MSAGLLPNVIVVGAPKSATTAVFVWLSDHPDALGSTRKETYYFVDIGTHMYEKRANFLHHGLDRYRRYFPRRPGKIPRVVIESTPSYMYSQNALDNLEHLETKPLFLFVLREPSRQLYSAFQYFRNNWNWVPRSMSFTDYLAAVRQGTHSFRGNELAQNAIQNAKYVDFLLRWRDRYGADRLRIYLYEDLLTDERGFIKRVATEVGLDPDFYDTYEFVRENETYEPRLGVLQSLNVSVRPLLLDLPGYDKLRAIYRRLNTRRPSPPSALDKQELASLQDEFMQANVRLAVEFGLDLTAWTPQVDEFRY